MSETRRKMREAVFLDRDGVLVRNRPDHVKCWEEVEFLEGIFDAMRRLADSALAVVVVTNQGAVGRGLLEYDAAWNLQRRIVEEIQRRGGRIDASYICPHHPDAGCACRKPSPGMIYDAQRDLDLDLGRSWLVGDAISDLEAATAAGVRGILVLTGRGDVESRRMSVESADRWPVVPTLAAAVDRILTHDNVRPHIAALAENSDP